MTVAVNEATRDRKAIAKRAGVVGVGTLASRALGLVRDLVLAAFFPRAETDLFFVAFTIPNALRQLLAEGALSSAFIPVLAGIEEKEGHAAAARFYAKLRGAMWITLLIFTVGGVAAAPLLCELFATGFHSRPGAFERTVHLTRAVFPYLFCMGLAALAAGALQTRRKFAVAAFAPTLLNVAMIACAIALPTWFLARGLDPLYALAVGALVGGVLQVLVQIPAVRAAGFREPLRFDLKDPGVREVIRRIGPMTFGLMIYEIDLVLSRRFLSEAGEGANSYFYYAQRLCDFPQGIFALALATATLPSLASLVARNDRSELAKTAGHALRLALFVALPATTLLVCLARPIVVAAFARGAFDATSVDGTSIALVVQGAGVFSVAVVRQLVPMFYAMGNTRTPVIISGLDLCAFIAIALGLRGHFGHVAISAAVTGSSIVQMALLAGAMRRELPELHARDVLPSALRSTFAAIVAGGAAWAASHFCAGFSGIPVIGKLLPAAIGGAVFVVAFIVAARLVGSEEQAELAAGIRRRLRRTPAAR